MKSNKSHNLRTDGVDYIGLYGGNEGTPYTVRSGRRGTRRRRREEGLLVGTSQEREHEHTKIKNDKIVADYFL